MPHYSYIARTRTGKAQKGTLEAPNQDEAVSVLQTRDLIVVSIQEKEASPMRLRRAEARFHAGIKSSDLIVFSRSLSAMIEAGLPLLRALETVRQQIRSQRLYNIMGFMIEDIRGGSTLRDAVAKHADSFDPFWISLIETGEASGQLAQSLDQISTHLEESGAIQRKVISALIYPGILMSVAVAAILIFTVFIIPTFQKLFSGFGAELPALTRAVMALSGFVKRYILLILAGMAGLWFLFQSWVKTKQGRWRFDKFRLQMPIMGAVFQGAAAEQFSSNLGTLLKAGVPILHALEITSTTCGNRVVAAIIDNMQAGVREGRPLAEPLSQTDIFPPMVAQMIAVGEQTGRLPAMLEQVTQYYAEQVSTAVDRMTSLLEPIMLVAMGLIIGTLVISMYLPVFQLTQAIRG